MLKYCHVNVFYMFAVRPNLYKVCKIYTSGGQLVRKINYFE